MMSEAGKRGPMGLGAFDAFAIDFWALANCNASVFLTLH